MKTTNSMKYELSTKDSNGDYLDITIHLSDDCKNGHNDFAITASAYDKKGKGSRADKYATYGGCCHEEILKAHPEFKIFVDLHLCDVKGAPMHASANGFYFISNPKSTERKPHLEVAQEFLRVHSEELEVLKMAEDELHFKAILESLGIVARWEVEAKKGIEELERLTGETFVDDSVRFQYTPLTEEENKLLKERFEYGYYTPERVEERKQAKIQSKRLKEFAKLDDERTKAIQKIENNFAIKSAVLKSGIDPFDAIYYDHTNELVFNWMNNNVSEEQFDNFVSTVDMDKLPKGLTIKFGKK